MICYCCYKDKDINEFGIQRKSKSIKYFCKECYKIYTQKERKERQVKYIFDMMLKITNTDQI